MSKSIYENTRFGTDTNTRLQLVLDALRATVGKQIGCVKYDFRIDGSNIICRATYTNGSVEFSNKFGVGIFSSYITVANDRMTIRVPYINTNSFICVASSSFIFWSCIADSKSNSVISGMQINSGGWYSEYRFFTDSYFKSMNNMVGSVLSVSNNVNYFKSQADSIVCVPFILYAELALNGDNKQVSNLYAFNVSNSVVIDIGYEYEIAGHKAIILRNSQDSTSLPKMLYFYE